MAKYPDTKARKHRAHVLVAQATSLGIDVNSYEILQDMDRWETIIHARTIAMQAQATGERCED